MNIEIPENIAQSMTAEAVAEMKSFIEQFYKDNNIEELVSDALVCIEAESEDEYWNIRCEEEYRDRILSGDWK